MGCLQLLEAQIFIQVGDLKRVQNRRYIRINNNLGNSYREEHFRIRLSQAPAIPFMLA